MGREEKKYLSHEHTCTNIHFRNTTVTEKNQTRQIQYTREESKALGDRENTGRLEGDRENPGRGDRENTGRGDKREHR